MFLVRISDIIFMIHWTASNQDDQILFVWILLLTRNQIWIKTLLLIKCKAESSRDHLSWTGEDGCTVTMAPAVPAHWLNNCLTVWFFFPVWFPVIWLISLPFRSPVEIYMTVPVGAAGVRGLGGRGYLAYAAGVGAMGAASVSAGGGASYGLKADKQAEEKLYDLLPGMELTPMNPAAMSLKAATIKPATQVTRHT